MDEEVLAGTADEATEEVVAEEEVVADEVEE
jgi:hypothetical protein